VPPGITRSVLVRYCPAPITTFGVLTRITVVSLDDTVIASALERQCAAFVESSAYAVSPTSGFVVLSVPPPESPSCGEVTVTGRLATVQPVAVAVIVAVPGASPRVVKYT
jgi:hypothetical protein